MHFFPQSNDLMITAAYTYLDGRGTLYHYNAFFSSLIDPATFKFGDEAMRLPIFEDELLSLPKSPSETDEQNAATVLGLFVQEYPIGMPMKSNQQEPSGSSRQELKLHQLQVRK
ncbi:hypothetical protein B0T10DRAFT_569678 [Thelonectria olida]|uniref:Uncharacterized protein n=1 Tax=Thelonectria olida TaxID=1576542 RepID=A0A9P8VQF8_9HYPO|nr:hypothetical protein B0T10DRAFT_569678 [Thelonectria olida]